ncbi:MAG: hypothetical protein RIQ43_223 [Pseudomonadota bacterium]|jgi:hypothetical protein
MSGPHIDLHRRQDQCRHRQRGIAGFAHLDEILPRNAFVNMNIILALFGHADLVAGFTCFRGIVVTHIQQRVGWQSQE